MKRDFIKTRGEGRDTGTNDRKGKLKSIMRQIMMLYTHLSAYFMDNDTTKVTGPGPRRHSWPKQYKLAQALLHLYSGIKTKNKVL
jgi:hypothetical protein